jgi:hypothetical protein
MQKIPPSKLKPTVTLLYESLDCLFSPFATGLALLGLLLELFGTARQGTAVKECLHLILKKGVFLHDAIVALAVFLSVLTVLDRVPEVVVSIETLSHLSSAWLVHVNYL